MNTKQKYTTVQITKPIKKILVEYCNKFGYKINRFVENLILEKINDNNKTSDKSKK